MSTITNGDTRYDQVRVSLHTNIHEAMEHLRTAQGDVADALMRGEVDTYRLARLLLRALPCVPEERRDYMAPPRREVEGFESDHGWAAPLWWSALVELAKVFPEKTLCSRFYGYRAGPAEYITSHTMWHEAGHAKHDGTWYTVLIDSPEAPL